MGDRQYSSGISAYCNSGAQPYIPRLPLLLLSVMVVWEQIADPTCSGVLSLRLLHDRLTWQFKSFTFTPDVERYESCVSWKGQDILFVMLHIV